nr:hypothetical protein [Pseudomonas aeruginosa]
MHEAKVLLLVDVLEYGVVQAGGEFRGDLVVGADEFHPRGFGWAEAAVGRGDGDLLVVRRVPVLDPVQVAEVEVQALDILGVQVHAVEGLRQQASRAGQLQGQIEDQLAGVDLGLGRAHFRGQAEGRIFVFRAAIGVERQQARAGLARRGVELDTGQGAHIETETDRALGEVRLVGEVDRLGPFPVAALQWWRGVVLELAVEVIILEVDVSRAAIEKIVGVGDG